MVHDLKSSIESLKKKRDLLETEMQSGRSTEERAHPTNRQRYKTKRGKQEAERAGSGLTCSQWAFQRQERGYLHR